VKSLLFVWLFIFFILFFRKKMVVGPSELGPQADIVFVIEGTAVNGAYFNDIKEKYIIPTLE